MSCPGNVIERSTRNMPSDQGKRNVRERPTPEFLLEMGELALDMITTSDVVKEFPVVGSAFKFVKAMDDVRSRLLAKKIDRFLSEPHLLASVAARRARDKIVEDEEHARRVGETMLMVLDKVTDFDKPVLLARSTRRT
jgi:hypothetical protein